MDIETKQKFATRTKMLRKERGLSQTELAAARKCRCSEALVLDIQNEDGSPSGLTEIKSNYDPSFIYRVGEIARVDDFNENRWDECSAGIHFFITREEAVNYIWI